MKKRKPPIVLATCLVLLLVTVGIMYKPGNAATDPHAHEQQQAPPPASTEQGTRPKMSTSDVSSMATGAMAPSATSGGRPRSPMPMGAPSSGGASIAVPKQQVYKPTPNDSSTSTQWYTDQTRK
jgi:hypothetical protein